MAAKGIEVLAPAEVLAMPNPPGVGPGRWCLAGLVTRTGVARSGKGERAIGGWRSRMWWKDHELIRGIFRKFSVIVASIGREGAGDRLTPAANAALSH